MLEKYASQGKRLVDEIQQTLMLFSEQSLSIHRDMVQNTNELQEFENLSQAWFLIIKKSLFEREYEVALLKVVYLIPDC